MISEKYAKMFCRDDISKIENYEMAKSDKTQVWECHHRDEIRKLPSGMLVLRSRQDLKDENRYYNCPANELIFLTKLAHIQLHHLARWTDPEQHEKMREAIKKSWENDTERREELSVTNKQRWADPEYKNSLCDKFKKAHSKSEVRQRHSEANRRRWADPEYKKRVSEKISEARRRKTNEEVG